MPYFNDKTPSKDVKVILHHLHEEEKELKFKLSQLEFSTDTFTKDFYSIQLHKVMQSIAMAVYIQNNSKAECCSKCKRPF